MSVEGEQKRKTLILHPQWCDWCHLILMLKADWDLPLQLQQQRATNCWQLSRNTFWLSLRRVFSFSGWNGEVYIFLGNHVVSEQLAPIDRVGIKRMNSTFAEATFKVADGHALLICLVKYYGLCHQPDGDSGHDWTACLTLVWRLEWTNQYNYIGENKKSDSCLETHENSRSFIWQLLCQTIQPGSYGTRIIRGTLVLVANPKVPMEWLA